MSKILKKYGLKTFYASQGGDLQEVVDAEEIIKLLYRSKPYKLNDVEGRFLVETVKSNMSKLSDYEGRDLCEDVQDKLEKINEITNNSKNINILTDEINESVLELLTYFRDRITESEKENDET